eukprot:CAMPEP_0118706032 /NCGR_PEP_ID=MMETSP0800-20121206/20287_1 /TAXON_ID=210618 ORGANISM="Striatella unipunctata, Strain CCMP2910" /NCGR_SAMPLE_ID=MMETSP0800 /ASSEMBLY_ACC=CAM_ASM_000638 /LENGTH=457 /DNA_ID=CAMNT_0006608431 /DNA_START=195 /DNA_END=1573 /DNA_ORIENTATION=-
MKSQIGTLRVDANDFEGSLNAMCENLFFDASSIQIFADCAGVDPKLSVTVVPIVYDVIPGEGINSQPQLRNQPKINHHHQKPSLMKRTRESSNYNNTQLLLHCVDGAIPYLTPHLIKNYFSSERVARFLSLAIAVRDSCCVPVYPSQEKQLVSNKKKKIETRVINPDKPCGYSFSSDRSVYGFLQIPRGFHTTALPSFDLIEDIREEEKKKLNVQSSSTGVVLCTPNGRQHITPDTYFASCKGLGCDASMPLFDMASTTDGKKRRQNVHLRTKMWLKEHLAMMERDNLENDEVWAPLVVGPTNNTIDTENLRELCGMKEISSVAVVGIHHLASRDSRREVLAQISQEVKNSEKFMTILSTKSIDQILDAMRYGAKVIGTDLPTCWAKEKKAIVLDLDGWKCTDSTPQCEKTQRDAGAGSFLLDLNSQQFAQDGDLLSADVRVLHAEMTDTVELIFTI